MKTCYICKSHFLRKPKESFERFNFRITCSRKCGWIYSGIIQRKRIQKQCPKCKKIFETTISKKWRKFCSRKCHYKGGKIFNTGYRGIWNRNKNKYELEHRIIMEKSIGRKLSKKEIVHHKNHNRLDNNIENLELLPSQAAHLAKHRKEKCALL